MRATHALIYGPEGGQWVNLYAYGTGSLQRVRETFLNLKAVRKDGVCFLVELDQIPRKAFLKLAGGQFSDWSHIFKPEKGSAYHYPPFVGFADFAAPSRNWGSLKYWRRKAA